MTGLLLATGCPFQWQHQFVNGVPCWICQSVANSLPVKILFPLDSENAVHGQIDEMIVHPFRLSQYSFLFQAQTIADGLTWIVFSSDRLQSLFPVPGSTLNQILRLSNAFHFHAREFPTKRLQNALIGVTNRF